MGSQTITNASNYTNNRFDQAIQYTDQRFNQVINYITQLNSQMQREVDLVRRGTNQGVAAATAMLTAIRIPDAGKSTINVGGGYYGGQAATALTMAHRSRGRKMQVVAAIGVPMRMVSGGNIAAAGAIGWQF